MFFQGGGCSWVGGYVCEVFAVECSQPFVGDEVYQSGACEFGMCTVYAVREQYAAQFCAVVVRAGFQTLAVFKVFLDNPAHEFPRVECVSAATNCEGYLV